MSNTKTNRCDNAIRQASTATLSMAGIILALIATVFAPPASADTTMAISAPPSRIFAGAGVSSVYPGYTNNLITFTLTGDTNDIDLIVTGAPANVTAGFSTNGPLGAINSTITTSNTMSVYLSAAVTNGAKGIYPLTITASNRFNGATTTVGTTLILPAVWVSTTGSANTNWSTAANWSVGGVPATGDDVKFEYASSNAFAPATIYQTNILFDTTVTLDSLSFLPQVSGVNYGGTINPGVTVAVSGPNGFAAGVANFLGATEKRVNLTLSGISGALVVTNPSASFSMWDFAGSGGTKSIFTLSGLGSLTVDVSRFGGGDTFLMTPNTGVGANNGGSSILAAGQVVDIFLARTNYIRATYAGDYSGYGYMTNSIMFFNNAGVNNGSISTAQLGITNAIFADSMTVASHSSGGNLSTLKFNAAFTPSNPVAFFRGANGGRMTFVGVGIDTGTNTASPRTRGAMDFNGGTVDMLVDTMWLGHNRTNFTGQNQEIGNLTFTKGTIDVNTLRAGYKQFPTTNFVQSTITVNGTNSTLVVNNTLELGYTAPATLVTGDGTPQTFGRLNINSNAVVRANAITVGTLSTNNQIVLTTGGHLILSNTIASSTTSLGTLNVNGSKMTFAVTAGVTNAFVTNLVVGANGTVVNITSLSGFSPTVPATNVIIAYQDSLASHNLSIGSLPPGFNNITLIDNLASKTIELRIATNAPAVLKWRGGQDSNWNHTSLNWLNTNTLATTRFFDGDRVIFDDAAGVPTTVTVTEAVNPGQVGTGILVSNSVNAFIFADGGGSFGGAVLDKQGTNSLQMDASGGAITAQVNGGKLKGSGTVGATIVAAGTSLDFAGSINGALQIAGTGVLNTGGLANNTVTVQSGGVMTNLGTIQGGGLTLNNGSFLFNPTGGWLRSIGAGGSVNVASNATLLNQGTIGDNGDIVAAQANTLTVNGTFKDLGVGNIYLTTFTLNSGGLFLPGGDGIGTTEIKTATVGATFNGRLQLQSGSTTIIKVNFANPQTNTLVVAQFTDFGGSTAVKAFDGATILMTNVNTGAGQFASGQSFRPFTGPSGANLGEDGAPTNRYPIINPIIPAANTKWDLANLRETAPNGILNIVGFPTTGTNITVAAFSDNGSIVTHLQWPSEYIGWRLQQQTNSKSVGIYTNWTTVSGSTTTNDLYITNSGAIDTSFFRMVYP